MTKHGMTNTRLYTIWSNMKKRCYNPNREAYKWYGGKGIKVCDEWHEFVPFMEWATNNGYAEDLVLDRKDSAKNYDPDNCQWITNSENSIKATEQRIGKPVKGNEAITYNNKTQTIREWAAELDIPYRTLYHRIQVRKWDVEKALTQPKGHNRRQK